MCTSAYAELLPKSKIRHSVTVSAVKTLDRVRIRSFKVRLLKLSSPGSPQESLDEFQKLQKSSGKSDHDLIMKSRERNHIDKFRYR